MTYEFDEDLSTPNWTIKIDTAANYGYFEHNGDGSGGGLWFVANEAGQTELADYDGVCELSQQIVRALRAAGYYLDDTFDPEPAEQPPEERRK